MKTKAQIQYKMRELEKELTKELPDSNDTAEVQKAWWKEYHMNLGRLKALNWVINRD